MSLRVSPSLEGKTALVRVEIHLSRAWCEALDERQISWARACANGFHLVRHLRTGVEFCRWCWLFEIGPLELRTASVLAAVEAGT
jgi:hypothetical protein